VPLGDSARRHPGPEVGQDARTAGCGLSIVGHAPNTHHMSCAMAANGRIDCHLDLSDINARRFARRDVRGWGED
jgi:hypothetical protein